MLNKTIKKGRTIVGKMKNHPIAVELRAREKTAFEILHPQVEIVKRSPTAQIVAGTALTAAVLSGHWSVAAVIASGWFGSKPLTHAVAGGVAGVGMVDAKFRAAMERLQAMQIGTGRKCGVIDRVFDGCVNLLVWMAEKLGMTYKQVNVWIFCVIMPLVILGQTATIIWLLLRR